MQEEKEVQGEKVQAVEEKEKKRVFERRQGDKVQEVDEVHKAEKGAVYKKEEV